MKRTIRLVEKTLVENLEDQYTYLKTCTKSDPKYQNKIYDIKYGYTKDKNEPMLSFSTNKYKCNVLEYPPDEKGRKYYYYIDNIPKGRTFGVIDIVDSLLESSLQEKASITLK